MRRQNLKHAVFCSRQLIAHGNKTYDSQSNFEANLSKFCFSKQQKFLSYVEYISIMFLLRALALHRNIYLVSRTMK